MRKERVYKTQVGQIPKIVNNFEPKTDNQKLFHGLSFVVIIQQYQL